MEKTANLLKVLSDENRLKILFMLKEKSMCVCEILSLLKITGATLSAHLKILKLNGIVASKKDGRWIEYSLTDKNVLGILGFIETIIEDKSEINEARRKIRSLAKRETICKKR
jgi:ArsR family transcriptional regulator